MPLIKVTQTVYTRREITTVAWAPDGTDQDCPGDLDDVVSLIEPTEEIEDWDYFEILKDSAVSEELESVEVAHMPPDVPFLLREDEPGSYQLLVELNARDDRIGFLGLVHANSERPPPGSIRAAEASYGKIVPVRDVVVPLCCDFAVKTKFRGEYWDSNKTLDGVIGSRFLITSCACKCGQIWESIQTRMQGSLPRFRRSSKPKIR